MITAVDVLDDEREKLSAWAACGLCWTPGPTWLLVHSELCWRCWEGENR